MTSWVVNSRLQHRQATPFAPLPSPLFPLPHLSPLIPIVCALFGTRQNSTLFFSMVSALFALKHPVGERVSMLNSPSRAKWPPSLRGNSSFVFFTTDNCSRTTARFPVLLGLRRRIRGRFSRTFGLGDGGKRLHVESLVVRVARYHAALESLHKQEPRSKVRFHVGGQPHLIVHKCLLVNDAAAFLQTRQQAAGNFHVAGEVRLQPRHVVRFFVHPDDTGELLRQFFHQLVRLEFGIGLEVENQHVLPTKALAARIHELACTQKNLNPRFVAFFVLPFFLGLLFFRFFLCRALLVFLDAFLRFLVFLFLFRFAQRLAVFFHQRGDLVPVQIEKGVVMDFALFHFSIALEFRLFFRFRPCVVLFELVEGLLVVVNLFEKSFQVRQFHLRLDREIKHALAHRPIDRRARNFNVVFVAPPVQPDFMRQLYPLHGAVVVVKNLFLHASYRRCLLRDQVCLRVKKYLPLHAGSCGHFELQRVLATHLRVSHKRQSDFVFLEVE